jgi:hypothetical protein
MKIENIFSFLVFIICFFNLSLNFVSSASVEETRSLIQHLNDPNEHVPEIYVDEIILDQAAYATGDIITGYFSISNASELSAKNITYFVQLVGNFNEFGFPVTVFDIGQPSESTVDINPLGEVRKKFSYQLPEEVSSEDLGIQIQTYLANGRASARNVKKFAITGPVVDYLEHIAQVQVGGEPFGLLDGPTIHEGENVFFAVSLKNDSEKMTLSPDVVIYDRLTTHRSLDSFEAEQITIENGETKEQRIELPTFNHSSGVYTAIIQYKDEKGRIRSGPFEVVYVVSGMDPKIDLVSIDRTDLRIGDQFNVFVKFSDTLVDIRLANFEENRPVSFDDISALITVYDANSKPVDSKRVFFDEGKLSTEIAFTAKKNMKGVYIKVDLYRGDEVIDKYQKVFPSDGILYVDENSKENIKTSTLIIATALFGFVVLSLIVILTILRRQKNKRQKEKNNYIDANFSY